MDPEIQKMVINFFFIPDLSEIIPKTLPPSAEEARVILNQSAACVPEISNV